MITDEETTPEELEAHIQYLVDEGFVEVVEDEDGNQRLYPLLET